MMKEKYISYIQTLLAVFTEILDHDFSYERYNLFSTWSDNHNGHTSVYYHRALPLCDS